MSEPEQDASTESKTQETLSLLSIADRHLDSLPVEEENIAFERSPPTLCHFCLEIVKTWNIRSDGLIDHYESLPALNASAENGCGLCVQLVYNFNQSTPFGLNDQNCFPLNGHVHSSRPRHDGWKLGRWYEKGVVNMVSVRPALTPPLRYGYGDNPFESTKDSLPLCKSWLKNCSESHRPCNSLQGQWKPTRLVYLKGDELRLTLSSDLDGYTKYATLSHCWGHHKFTKLMRSNLEKFRVHIPLERLTKTFKDAIYITRFLGLHYLWIDSLCILQDDPADWIRESSSMSGVYGGATINIAATGAVDGSLGCFFNRHTSWRCQIRAMVDGKDSLLDCIPSGYRDSLRDAPLATRGWVMQERFLSHRTLHFTQKEIFWECHEKVASETFPERIPFSSHLDLEEGLSLRKRPLTHAIWLDLMEEYSRCKLTFARDKLVAISGLARMFQAEIGGDYVAGFWKKDLESQLLWEANPPDERPLPPIAPSWSWASLRGAVTFNRQRGSKRWHPFDINIKIEQVDIIPCSPSNPFGEVSYGSLRINCRYLVAGTLHYLEPAEPRDRTGYSFRIGRRNCPVYPTFDTRSAFDMFEKGGVNIYLLPVPLAEFYLHCLMIQETGEQKGQFRRIGVLFGWEDLMRGLEEAFKEPPSIRSGAEGSSLPNENWNGGEDFIPSLVDETKCVEIRVNEDGKKRYIIDLV